MPRMLPSEAAISALAWMRSGAGGTSAEGRDGKNPAAIATRLAVTVVKANPAMAAEVATSKPRRFMTKYPIALGMPIAVAASATESVVRGQRVAGSLRGSVDEGMGLLRGTV